MPKPGDKVRFDEVPAGTSFQALNSYSQVPQRDLFWTKIEPIKLNNNNIIIYNQYNVMYEYVHQVPNGIGPTFGTWVRGDDQVIIIDKPDLFKQQETNV